MFLVDYHKVDQPYAKYEHKFWYVQQISIQMHDIIHIYFNFYGFLLHMDVNHNCHNLRPHTTLANEVMST